MMEGGRALGPADAAAAVAAVRAYLRIGHDGEDALIESLCEAAAGLCEAFTRQVLIVREGTETVAASGRWERLAAAPVRAITAVERVGGDGIGVVVQDAGIDIDPNCDGWVRAGGGGAVRVTVQAGLAADWAGLPEAITHGIVRMAGHLFMDRDAGRAPPAAVTALWRPWRRLGVL